MKVQVRYRGGEGVGGGGVQTRRRGTGRGSEPESKRETVNLTAELLLGQLTVSFATPCGTGKSV